VSTQTVTTTLTVISCDGCGVTFGISVGFYSARRDDHKTFYCPNGCRRAYSVRSETEQLQIDLRYARSARDAARDQATAAERSARAHKGHATRLRNLIARGVCPVPGCRRNFANVRAHMAAEHPNFHLHDVTPDGGVS